MHSIREGARSRFPVGSSLQMNLCDLERHEEEATLKVSHSVGWPCEVFKSPQQLISASARSGAILLGLTRQDEGPETVRLIRAHCPLCAILCMVDESWENVASLLQAGADDVVVRPTDIRSLFWRASMRAAARQTGSEPTIQKVGPATLFASTRTLLWNERQVVLTQTEFRLFTHLLRLRPLPVPAEEIVKVVLEYGAPSNARFHVQRLRAKLSHFDSLLQIHTLRGVGYSLVLHES